MLSRFFVRGVSTSAAAAARLNPSYLVQIKAPETAFQKFFARVQEGDIPRTDLLSRDDQAKAGRFLTEALELDKSPESLNFQKNLKNFKQDHTKSLHITGAFGTEYIPETPSETYNHHNKSAVPHDLLASLSFCPFLLNIAILNIIGQRLFESDKTLARNTIHARGPSDNGNQPSYQQRLQGIRPHTDVPFADNPPDSIILTCFRNGVRDEDAVGTVIFPVSAILERLPESTIQELMKPNFYFEHDNLEITKPVLTLVNSKFTLTLSGNATTLTSGAEEALINLENVMSSMVKQKNVVNAALKPGGLLLFSNKQNSHCKEKIVPKVEKPGTERFLTIVTGSYMTR